MPPAKRFQTRQAVSAGGVVYRHAADGLEVVLLQSPAGAWGLPKGTPDDHETIAQAAVREVHEETGLEVALEDKIGAIEYWFVRPKERARFHKYVHFWLMRPTGGDFAHHDHEHIDVRWFPIGEALRTVAHQNSADILQRAADILERRTTERSA